MSGHSKWSTIKRQKGAADAKRGQTFTKLANAIIIAVREGGGITDPNSNFKLRLAVDRARAANMPKENIERAIARGSGTGDKTILEEAIYEGFGPYGTAVIVEAATDNKQRTIQGVKNVFDRNGGSLATPGAVGYQFQQKGFITAQKNGKPFDEIFLVAAESGAEDVEDSESNAFVYTKPEDLKRVKDELENNGVNVIDAELIRHALNPVEVSDKDIAQKILSFLEKLEELADVQKVYSNLQISDDILQTLS